MPKTYAPYEYRKALMVLESAPTPTGGVFRLIRIAVTDVNILAIIDYYEGDKPSKRYTHALKLSPEEEMVNIRTITEFLYKVNPAWRF